MTLPTSGPLSFSAINTELGRSSTAQMSLQTAETGGYVAINQNSASRPNGLAPYAVSEWYGYNQNAAGSKTLYINFYAASCTGDSMQVYKNGVQVFSAFVGGASGSISVVAGDSIQVSVTSAIKGIACEGALAEISANSYYSDSAPGFSATATVYYTIQSIDPASIYASGYVGMI